MARKVLQVLETAYRCTVQEQDDPVVWITAMMKNAGGDLSLLLRGPAVNYAVNGQDASGLAFGEKKQNQPPRLDEDLGRLLAKGVEVYFVQEDASERGLEPKDLVKGVRPVDRRALPQLLARFDQVWHW